MAKTSFSKNKRIHMVGVGGAGMSGLAALMAGMGCRVSGSDLKATPVTARLECLGIKVFHGHDAANTSGAELIVASAAVPGDNPELAVARDRGLPIFSRARMLGELMAGTVGVAVAGTHGKTTTTSMLADVLEAGGLDPTVLVGGDLERLNGNARLGKGKVFLAEACEAFNSFLELHPTIAVVTNLEADHLDFHGSLEGVVGSFREFLSQIEPDGCAVVCVDCANARAAAHSVGRRAVTYGLSPDAEFCAVDARVDSRNPSFRLLCRGRDCGEYTLRVPGCHNVRNALAALAVGRELGLGFDVIRDALAQFKGTSRRFEILGTTAGIVLVDDYAHHPTEIRATLAAARAWGLRVVAVFQPHLFSRTRAFLKEFAASLSSADLIVLTEIYPARERPIPGISASLIVDAIKAKLPGKDVVFVPEKDNVPDVLLPSLQPGDVVVVMGAGDIRMAAERLLLMLGSAPQGPGPSIEVKET